MKTFLQYIKEDPHWVWSYGDWGLLDKTGKIWNGHDRKGFRGHEALSYYLEEIENIEPPFWTWFISKSQEPTLHFKDLQWEDLKQFPNIKNALRKLVNQYPITEVYVGVSETYKPKQFLNKLR